MVSLSAPGYYAAMSNLPIANTSAPFGEQLRRWRQHRRMSQLNLALEAEISSRHLSFLENGRAQPSRTMVLRLSQWLKIPLRERNRLLKAAGYAPLYPERTLNDSALKVAREAVELVLKGHEPYPALAIDRHWQLVTANSIVPRLLSGVGSALLQPPVNVLRLSLHPDGLAPQIVNLMQWRMHIFERLRQQIEATADPILEDLLEELRSYPGAENDSEEMPVSEPPAVVLPFRLNTPQGVLSFISTTTIFGTPVDITLSELAVESFFPADAATAGQLQQWYKEVENG